MSRSLFQDALAAEGVTGPLADLAFSIYAQESGGGKNTKTSNRGAVGGMQVIPSTFREVADKDWDISDPSHNARAGIRYLKKLNKQAGGDTRLTAAGYYGGPGGLEKARRGVAVSDPVNPKAPNTLEYAQQVFARMRKGVPPPGGIVYMQGNASAPSTPVAQVPPTPVAPGPVASGQGVPLPPELLEYLASRNRAPVLPAAQNAWLSFLDGMRGAKRERGAPVEAQELDYRGVLVEPMQGAMPSGRVDFSPFAAFSGLGLRKGRGA